MARDAVYTALTTDQRMIDLGFDADTVLVNYDGSERPSDTMFIVLTWGVETIELRGDDSTFIRTSRPLDVWVHMYRDYSTDFVRIDSVLKTVQDVISSLTQVPGDDGYTLTLGEFAGRSRDLKDDTYQTICRSASYKILSRETEPV